MALFGVFTLGRPHSARLFQRALAIAASAAVLTGTVAVTSPQPAAAATTAVAVSWGDVTPKVGQSVQVTGTVTTDTAVPSAARTVVLQRLTSSGDWTDAVSTTSTPDGGFSLRLPTGTAGAGRYRVLVQASGVDTEVASVEAAVVVSRHTTTVNATLSATRVRAGGRVFVAGRVNPNWDGRKVVLQRRVPGHWVAVGPQRTVSGASYRFPVPTGWYGDFSYRVVVAGTRYATDKVSPSVRLRVVPRYRPAGRAGAYRPIASSWIRFNPCEPVTYRVNARQGGRGALADVKAAVRQVQLATGLRFRYAGLTTAIPQFNGRDWWSGKTDLVVAWARPRQTTALRGAPAGVVGVGGPTRYAVGLRNGDDTSVGWILQNGVVLDATDRFRGGLGRGYTRGEIVLHELGHAFGLGHVRESRQVMYPSMRPTRALFGAGDLGGMAKVGANRGCIYLPSGKEVAQSMIATRTTSLPTSTVFVRDHLPKAR